jgi:hypothetical protein
VLSKVVRYEGADLLLQSSAVVHQGTSGCAPLPAAPHGIAYLVLTRGARGRGLVVATATGAPLGLVTSNARHSSGQVVPSLNFAIPLGALAPVAAYLATGGASDVQSACVVQTAPDPCRGPLVRAGGAGTLGGARYHGRAPHRTASAAGPADRTPSPRAPVKPTSLAATFHSVPKSSTGRATHTHTHARTQARKRRWARAGSMGCGARSHAAVDAQGLATRPAVVRSVLCAPKQLSQESRRKDRQPAGAWDGPWRRRA